MEPLSALAAASAAFGALKKGFAVGRDIESMAGDLSRWMGALSDIEQANKEAKNPPIFKKILSGKSVEQEAIEAFAAKQKAEAQRYELQQWISLTMGKSKWDELIRMEGQIRKKRQETLYRQRERRQKFVEVVAWIVLVGLGAAILVAFIVFLKASQANADTALVECRLAKYEKVKNEWHCYYLGANNTTESMIITEFCPRTYMCEYSPNSDSKITKWE